MFSLRATLNLIVNSVGDIQPRFESSAMRGFLYSVKVKL